MARRRWVGLVVAVGLLGGCGSGGEHDISEAGLRRSQVELFEALRAGDAKGVLRFQVKRCSRVITASELQDAMDANRGGLVRLRGLDIRIDRVQISGARGRVTWAIVDADGNLAGSDTPGETPAPTEWVVEDGAWRNPDCFDG